MERTDSHGALDNKHEKGYPPGLCIFCKKDVNEEERMGKIHKTNGTTVHYFCMLFASGLSQKGGSEAEGILGFLERDIFKEVKRSARLKCVFCKQTGATIGCVVSRCRQVFHYPCGLDNGVLNQYYGMYCSYCDEHRPKQTVPTSDRLAFHGTAKSTCAICMCAVETRASNNTLRSPCCKNSWFHRVCIQQQATSSGVHFFRCPLCNNKEIFQEEMLKFGIHVPDQDASWELESGAFRELLERHSKCDVPKCVCSKGREYTAQDGSKWEIMLCDWCGSQGTHMHCSGLKTPMDDWVCPDCVAMVAKGPNPSKPQPQKESQKWLHKKVNKLQSPQSQSSSSSKVTVGKKRKREYSVGVDPTKRRKFSAHRISIAGPKHKVVGASLTTETAVKSQGRSHKKAKQSPTATHSGGRSRATVLSVVSPRSASASSSSVMAETSEQNKKRRHSRYLEIKSTKDFESRPEADEMNGASFLNRELSWLLQSDIATGKNLGTKFAAQFTEDDKQNKEEKSGGRNIIGTVSLARQFTDGELAFNFDNDSGQLQGSGNENTVRAKTNITRQKANLLELHSDSLEKGPRWLKKLLAEDIFTGRALGAKFINQSPTVTLTPEETATSSSVSSCSDASSTSASSLSEKSHATPSPGRSKGSSRKTTMCRKFKFKKRQGDHFKNRRHSFPLVGRKPDNRIQLVGGTEGSMSAKSGQVSRSRSGICRLMNLERSSSLTMMSSGKRKPKWFRTLMSSDILTGSNLGRKLAAQYNGGESPVQLGDQIQSSCKDSGKESLGESVVRDERHTKQVGAWRFVTLQQ